MTPFLTVISYDWSGLASEETRHYLNGARPLTIVFHDGNEERRQRHVNGDIGSNVLEGRKPEYE